MRRLAQTNNLRKRWLLIATFLSFFAAACGDDNSNQFQFAQLTDLQVYATSPANGETAVDSLLPLEIRWTEPVASSSLTGKIRVTVAGSGQAVEGITTLSQADMVSVFTPTNSQWQGNVQLIVDVDAGVQAISGRRLQQPFRMTFTTGVGGQSTHSNPGVAPELVSVFAGSLRSGPYGGEFPIFTLYFSEDVPTQSVADFITVKSCGPIRQISCHFMDVEVEGGRDGRMKRLYLYGEMYSLGDVDLELRAGYEDFNGDIGAGKKFDFDVIF